MGPFGSVRTSTQSLKKVSVQAMLSVHGEVAISVGGMAARFLADGPALKLDIDDPISFLKASRLFTPSNLGTIKLVARELDSRGLTLSIVSRENVLVVMGHGATSGITGWLMGVPNVEIRAVGLIGRITG